ncbi:MAG TPA: alpha/beta fold hydrolase [Candidatus Krumholzibacteria bacterium]|nr:alpha/beta fold hydrolase [Candidatus Krumholzibacteria bacterium]
MTISLRPHRFEAGNGRAVDAELGSLEVPMRRGAPAAGAVRLAFVRLPATADRGRPPIVFLNGGPGLSGIRFGRGRYFGLFDGLRTAGDVILLDQRGSGSSTPSLECAEPLALPFEQAFSREEVVRAVIESTRRCAEQLARSGIDIAAFNSAESAADVADLARALGAKQISLLGWSYGTHLAMAVLRRHDDLVARAVLAGPEGPDHTYKLPSRIERQLASIGERVRTAMPRAPDFVESVRDVLASVAREPARITLPVSGGTPRPAVIGRFDLEWMTAEGIGDVRMIARMPRWYRAMARGDFGDIARDDLLRSHLEELRTGLNRSLVRACMDCASGASLERWRRIEDEARATLLGRTIDFPFPEVCDAIGRPDLGDAFRAPLHSRVPTLFVTGTLDARTPADNVADLAPGFLNARHLVVEDAGHADLLLPAGVQRTIVRFFTDGDADTAHARAETPLRFEPATPVLLYDADCGFCRRRVEGLRAHVGDAVAFEPYQRAAWSGISTTDLARSVHFVDGNGDVSKGAEAILRARAAGRRRSAILWMYRRVPGFAPIAELVYDWVARRRGRIGSI